MMIKIKSAVKLEELFFPHITEYPQHTNRAAGTHHLFTGIDNISSPCPLHVISEERMS